MSSKAAIGCLLSQLWRRHLVNAYEGTAGMVLFAGKLCDPCLSALRVCVRTKMALYKYTSLPFLSVSLVLFHDTFELY